MTNSIWLARIPSSHTGSQVTLWPCALLCTLAVMVGAPLHCSSLRMAGMPGQWRPAADTPGLNSEHTKEEMPLKGQMFQGLTCFPPKIAALLQLYICSGSINNWPVCRRNMKLMWCRPRSGAGGCGGERMGVDLPERRRLWIEATSELIQSPWMDLGTEGGGGGGLCGRRHVDAHFCPHKDKFETSGVARPSYVTAACSPGRRGAMGSSQSGRIVQKYTSHIHRGQWTYSRASLNIHNWNEERLCCSWVGRNNLQFSVFCHCENIGACTSVRCQTRKFFLHFSGHFCHTARRSPALSQRRGMNGWLLPGPFWRLPRGSSIHPDSWNIRSWLTGALTLQGGPHCADFATVPVQDLWGAQLGLKKKKKSKSWTVLETLHLHLPCTLSPNLLRAQQKKKAWNKILCFFFFFFY